MARNKDKTKKEQLVHEKNVNKKAPVWIYLKTKDRDLIRGRKRHWRSAPKVGKKNKKKVKKSGRYRKYNCRSKKKAKGRGI